MKTKHLKNHPIKSKWYPKWQK